MSQFFSYLLGQSGEKLTFSVGEELKEFKSRHWSCKMHKGTTKEGNQPITVFVYAKTPANQDFWPLYENALKRLKTLRFPTVLKYVDGFDLPDAYYVATEEVSPLTCDIANDTTGNAKVLGLHAIVRAISWLNNECNMIHGNLSMESIFITPAGEWKLGGFEFLVEPKTQTTYPFGKYLYETLPDYRSPELVNHISDGNINVLLKKPVHSLDAWSLGCLMYEIYNGKLFRSEDLSKQGNVPKELINHYRSLLSRNISNRRNPNQLLESSYFTSNSLVEAMSFLEVLALKTSGEKEVFFSQFSRMVDTFPNKLCKYKILPQLLQALTYGQSGISSFASVLISVLQIGISLTDDEYKTLVTPAVVQLFSSKERAVRIHLLEHLSKYSDNLTSELVNSKIFPSIISGFSDAYGPLRELSLKSLVYLAPKLPTSTVSGTLVELVQKMQSDSEPRIRTNAIYCLAKITQYLSPATRDRVLANQFALGLKDNFAHCRVAALVSIVATMEYHPAVRCARFIMPRVAPLTIDPVKEVRVQAIRSINAMVVKLKEHSGKIEEKLQADRDAVSKKNMGGVNNTDNTTLNEAANMVGWAIGSISKKLGYEGEEEGKKNNIDMKNDTNSISNHNNNNKKNDIKKITQTTTMTQKNTNNNDNDDDFFDFFGNDNDDNEEITSINLSSKPAKKKTRTQVRTSKKTSSSSSSSESSSTKRTPKITKSVTKKKADVPLFSSQGSTANDNDTIASLDWDFNDEINNNNSTPKTPVKNNNNNNNQTSWDDLDMDFDSPSPHKQQQQQQSINKKTTPIKKTSMKPLRTPVKTPAKITIAKKSDDIDDWESFLN